MKTTKVSKAKQEEDQKRQDDLQTRLQTSKAQLTKLAGKLETTKTLASDMIRIRNLRMVIDDCNRSMAGA